MEFDFSKLISFKDIDKVKIGEKYYCTNIITSDDVIDLEHNSSLNVLKDIDKHKAEYPFYMNDNHYYCFLYPYEEEEKQYLTYEELKEKWIKNPTELYRYQTEVEDVIGMITAFDDRAKLFRFNNQIFSEYKDFGDDNQLIRNLTDINGNPLTK